ncbi:MAG: GNAT family N-acetyltransferase [Casimicrobium sp.]
MNVVEHKNLDAFWARVEAFLSADPANNTMPLTTVQRFKTYGARAGEQFFSIENAGEVVGCVTIVDTRTIFAAAMQRDAAETFARYIRENNIAVAGITGMRDVVESFTESFAQPHRVYVNLMLYRLMSEPSFGRASGRARLAELNDFDLIVKWQDEFEKEAHVIVPKISIEERIRRRLDQRELMLWIDGDEPVAMAGVMRLPANSARIGPVYTPPALRAHGYAQAVVAAISAEASRDAKRTTFLFTDAAYPASNKCYQRIGYAHIADHTNWLYG